MVIATVSHYRTSPTFILCSTFEPRTRRFSASFSPLHSPGVIFQTQICSFNTGSISMFSFQTPGSPRVPPSRVSQLKKEEAGDVVGRVVASEKEFQSTLQISASWEDLSLVNTQLLSFFSIHSQFYVNFNCRVIMIIKNAKLSLNVDLRLLAQNRFT